LIVRQGWNDADLIGEALGTAGRAHFVGHSALTSPLEFG
jgi:hypothetical protein